MRLRRKGRGPEDGSFEDESTESANESIGVGPYDADAVDLESEPFSSYIDLGGLLLPKPPDGVDIQLSVDEDSGLVMAVLVAGSDGAVELRPYAAKRNGDMWTEVRPAIAADAAQHGGTASPQNGPFGTELNVVMPVQSPDGSAAQQVSRIVGVNGPRWMLRATILGLPAVDHDQAGPWVDYVQRVVVRRGAGAMPPGEAIEMHLPADSERAD